MCTITDSESNIVYVKLMLMKLVYKSFRKYLNITTPYLIGVAVSVIVYILCAITKKNIF